MKQVLIGLFTCLLIGAAGVAPAEACSCVESGPACEDYWRVSAVFAGRVLSISRDAGKPGSRAPATRRVRLEVTEAFTGVGKGTVEVTTGSGGGDCGFPFREGAEYLVYATGADGAGGLTVGICSRTRELDRAGEDLDYARRVASGAAVEGRIAGGVMLETRSLGRASARAPRPLEGVGVRLMRDGQSTRVVTGADGRFSAEGLTAGRYEALLELPEGVYAEGWPRRIELRDARSCAELHVSAFADGRVSGRIVDAAGRPVAGLTVELTIPAGIDEAPGPERIRDLTDSEGRYELAHVPAGRFVVGINTQQRQGGEPEPRLFHPGVAALNGATRVSLRAGERVTLRDFQLPRELAYVPVSGVVTDAGGVPAANARVYLKGPAEADYILSEPAVTDAGGRFVIAAVAGRGYRIFAERPRGEGPGAGADSSDLTAFAPEAGAAPLRLVLRRRY
jgi:hypothetical protein